MLLIFVSLLASAAQAANLTPDRPGVGESTGTVGDGGFVAEGGLQASLLNAGGFGSYSQIGTSSVTGRLGFGRQAELRFEVPDLVYTLSNSGRLGVGALGIGGKFAQELTAELAVSAVPTVRLSLDTGDPLIAVSLNATYDTGRASPWVNLTPTYTPGGLSAFLGGGVSLPADPGGAYVNAGVYDNGGWMVGAGGWLGLDEGLQADFGLDVQVISGLTIWLPTAGASAAF
jgi:hypothetical protein